MYRHKAMLILFLFLYLWFLSISEFLTSLEIASRILALVRSNSIGDIKKLLSPYPYEQRKIILSTDVCGSSILYQAVGMHLCSSIINFLHECGADPNSFGRENYRKVNCLSKAAALNCRPLIELLLSRCADINGIVSSYETPITNTCFLNREEATKTRVEHGAISFQTLNRNVAQILT